MQERDYYSDEARPIDRSIAQKLFAAFSGALLLLLTSTSVAQAQPVLVNEFHVDDQNTIDANGLYFEFEFIEIAVDMSVFDQFPTDTLGVIHYNQLGVAQGAFTLYNADIDTPPSEEDMQGDYAVFSGLYGGDAPVGAFDDSGGVFFPVALSPSDVEGQISVTSFQQESIGYGGTPITFTFGSTNFTSTDVGVPLASPPATADGSFDGTVTINAVSSIGLEGSLGGTPAAVNSTPSRPIRVLKRHEIASTRVGPMVKANASVPDGLSYTFFDQTGTPGGFNEGENLPVELSSFTGQAAGEGAVQLNWRTLSESGNAGFEVQMKRALDGAAASFEQVGYVPTAVEGGTTTEAQDYSFRLADLEPGTYRFRLNQVDVDGHSELHGTSEDPFDVEVQVSFAGSHVLSAAYPNPFSQQARFDLTVAETQEVSVSLYNTLGQQVRTLHSGVIEEGDTQAFSVESGELASGVYIYRVEGETFSDSGTLTLVR